MTDVFATLDREWRALRRDATADAQVAGVLAVGGATTLGRARAPGPLATFEVRPRAFTDRLLQRIPVSAG